MSIVNENEVKKPSSEYVSLILTREFLEKEYITENKQAKTIAFEVNLSVDVVRKYLKKFGIFKIKSKVGSGHRVKNSKLSKEYLESICNDLEVKEIAEQINCSPSTVRKYIWKYNLKCKNSRVGNNLGETGWSWKGGKYVKEGYIMVWIDKGTYISEHKLVMEKYLGRDLVKDEIVHHINGDKKDNRIENLLLMDRKQHDLYHLLCKKSNMNFKKHSRKDILNLLQQIENVCRSFREDESEELGDKKPLG